MPVIGRLDEQVGRVLIEPVARRRDAEDPPPPSPPEAPAAPPAETVEESGERRGPEELPVWLL